MLYHLLKVALRNLVKNQAIVLINTLGVGIALAVMIVAYVNFRYNKDFDKELAKTKDIYRVNLVRNSSNALNRYGDIPLPLANSIIENSDASSTRFSMTTHNVGIKDNLFKCRIAYADADIFDFFSYPLLKGDLTSFTRPATILISERFAKKLFGDSPEIGRVLTQHYAGEEYQFIVGGIFKDLPLNSSFYFDALTLFNNRPVDSNASIKNNENVSLFLKVSNKATIDRLLEKQLSNTVKDSQEAVITRIYLDPFDGIAARSRKLEVHTQNLHYSLPSLAVNVPMILAILILSVACLNYANMTIAFSERRLKEIGMRKVMGGVRSGIMRQFLMESFIHCILFTLVALLFSGFLIRQYNAMWSFIDLKPLNLADLEFTSFLLVMLLVVLLVGGFYPALYLSRFQPTAIFKGKLKLGGNNFFSKTMLTIQLALTLITVVAAVGFIKNASYQNNIDDGFETASKVYVRLENADDFLKFQGEMDKLSEVEVISGSADQLIFSNSAKLVECNEWQNDVITLSVDESYLEMFDIPIIAGRGFTSNAQSDMRESAIVTEQFVKEFDLQNPLGQKVTVSDTLSIYIIGVARDFYAEGSWNKLKPVLIHMADPSEYKFLTVSSSVIDTEQLNMKVNAAWNNLFPDKIYEGRTFEEIINRLNELTINVLIIFIFIGVISGLLALVGIYSIISLIILRKGREIGIKKVFGASLFSLARSVNSNFTAVFFIAVAIGTTIGYFFVNQLLRSLYPNHAAFGFPAFFILSAVIFVVVLFIVFLSIRKISFINPILIVKEE